MGYLLRVAAQFAKRYAGRAAGAAASGGRAVGGRLLSSTTPLQRIPASSSLAPAANRFLTNPRLFRLRGARNPFTGPGTIFGNTAVRTGVKPSGAPMYRIPTTADRMRQVARSPISFLNRQLSPRALTAEAAFALGYGPTVAAFQNVRGNVQERERNRAQTPSTPMRPTNTPSNQAPGGRAPTPATGGTYNPNLPIRPGNNPYGAGRAPSTLVAPGNRQRGNQPTTLTPGSVPTYTPPTLTLPTTPAVPPSVPSVPESEAASEANMRNFQDELNRIQGTYGSLVEQIRGAYNLAPTEEEKELLLNDLADLEAENEAAKLAVSQLFAEKDKTIGALAAKSKQYATERSQGVGQLYADAGQELRDFDAMRLAEIAEETPGYGAAIRRDSNINADLLSTMAPIAQSYSQQIGDIGTQGLDYIRGLTQGVGAARGGELQSQYASSRAGIRSNWTSDVADRIANERLQMAQTLGDLAERQLGIMGSMSPPTSTGPTTADIYEAIDQLASTPGMTDEAFQRWMESYFPGRPVEDLDLQTFSGIQDYLNQQEAVQNQGGVDALLQFFPGMTSEEAMAAFNNMPESQQALLLNLLQIQ